MDRKEKLRVAATLSVDGMKLGDSEGYAKLIDSTKIYLGALRDSEKKDKVIIGKVVSKLLTSAERIKVGETSLNFEMMESRGRDIIQGDLDDCSLIAGLIVGIEHARKFKSNTLLSCISPHDPIGLPELNSTGEYTAKFFFNGEYRNINVTDTLLLIPGPQIFATTKKRKSLWPALVEKGYLELMGGYNLAGSDSSIDLHMLMGWIPESILLGGSDYRSDKVWARLVTGFLRGTCIVTIGTGKFIIPHPELVSSHNYAILDFRLENGQRVLELLNPWGSDPFLVAWDSLSTYFNSLYVNWNPAKFSHSTLFHSSTKDGIAQLRLEVESEKSSEIWVLLSRHIQSRFDTEYIGLEVTQGISHDNQSPAVDGPHVLIRLVGDPAIRNYNAFISSSSQTIEFNVQVFSQSPVKIFKEISRLPHSVKIQGKWSELTAGGHQSRATWMNNPQYKLTIPSMHGVVTNEISLICKTVLCSNIVLLRGNGERVTHFEDRLLVAGNSQYSYGTSLGSANNLEGDYTLVVSNYSSQQEGDFEIITRSTLPIKLSPIPKEGAGLYSRIMKGLWTPTEPNPEFEIILKTVTNLQIRLQLNNSERNLPLEFSIYTTRDDGVRDQLVQSTRPYSDISSGVLLNIKLNPVVNPSLYF